VPTTLQTGFSEFSTTGIAKASANGKMVCETGRRAQANSCNSCTPPASHTPPWNKNSLRCHPPTHPPATHFRQAARRVWLAKPMSATKHYEDLTRVIPRGYNFAARVWLPYAQRRGPSIEPRRARRTRRNFFVLLVSFVVPPKGAENGGSANPLAEPPDRAIA